MAVGSLKHNRAAAQPRVIHEVAADQVVLIADPGGLVAVGSEQQAWRLNAAGRQDIGAGDDPKSRAGEGADPQAGDPAAGARGLDFGDVGVEISGHIVRSGDFVAVVTAEAGGRAELRDNVDRAVTVERTSRASGLPIQCSQVAGSYSRGPSCSSA